MLIEECVFCKCSLPDPCYSVELARNCSLLTSQDKFELSSSLGKQVGGSHYKSMEIEPIVFCQKNRLGYAESLAIKYICRHRMKGGEEDLLKAIHCLEMLIEMEYPNGPGTTEADH